MRNYRATYAGPEFQRWASAEGLIEAEQFLIGRYLDKGGDTLEAGTGGGRILYAMAAQGFERLTGFDGVGALIEAARKRGGSEGIEFDVQDARELCYSAGTFEQIIYLQQILCFIAEGDGRKRAVAEAYRILRPEGIALFSFLLYEARLQSAVHRAMVVYLWALRAFRKRRTPAQSMPWFSHGGKLNREALLDREPYVYWFRCEEAVDLLSGAGFEIAGIGTLEQIQKGGLCGSLQELKRQPMKGMLYVVCQKPA